MPLENLTRPRIISALNLGYPGDIEDIRFLIRKMEIWTLAQVDELLGRFYPYDALTPQARALIEGLLPRPQSPTP